MCTFGVMRSLITGIDAEGRSCIAEDVEVVPAPVLKAIRVPSGEMATRSLKLAE